MLERKLHKITRNFIEGKYQSSSMDVVAMLTTHEQGAAQVLDDIINLDPEDLEDDDTNQP